MLTPCVSAFSVPFYDVNALDIFDIQCKTRSTTVASVQTQAWGRTTAFQPVHVQAACIGYVLGLACNQHCPANSRMIGSRGKQASLLKNICQSAWLQRHRKSRTGDKQKEKKGKSSICLVSW